MGFEVPESSDDLEVLVDGVAVAAALSKDLPVFESGDDMFDAGSDFAVRSVGVVADDESGVVACWAVDRGDAAASAVAEGLVVAEQMCDGWRGRR
nr:hypothetical protein [Mycobacterium persicum]